MKKKYILGRNLSLIYIIINAISLKYDIRLIGIVFQIFAYPLILMNMSKLLKNEYNYNVRKITIITIIILVISTLLPIIGMYALSDIVDYINTTSLKEIDSSRLNTAMIFTRITNFLLLLRGFVYFVFSYIMVKKILDFKIFTKVISIGFGVLGIHIILTSIISIFPVILMIFSHNESMSILSFLNYSLPCIQLVIMFCLFFEFIISNKRAENSKVLIGDETDNI